MSNPFSPANLTPTWVKATAILKGDLLGHPFRGNQWTAAADAQGDLFPASNLHLHHDEGASASDVSGQHLTAAELHVDQKNRLKELAQKAVDEGHPVTAGKLVRAIGEHADAALEHQNTAKVTLDKGVGQDSVDAAYRAVKASRDANAATYVALEDARATGLAPADLMKSVDFTKGDLPGHPFRGNQYTEGSLSDTSTRLASFVTKERTNIPPATAHDIADSHREHATLHRQASDQLRQHVDIMTSPENLHRDGEATASQVKATLAQAKEYAKAADLHDTASVAHQKAADTVLKSQGEYGGKLGLNEKAPTATQVSSASSNAAKASVAAENIVPFADANVQLPLGAPYYGG